MTRILSFSLVLLITAVFSAASFAQQDDSMEGANSFMFVQSAQSMSYKDGKLTLNKVSPSMIFFADRPRRMAGHFPVTHFLQM